MNKEATNVQIKNIGDELKVDSNTASLLLWMSAISSYLGLLTLNLLPYLQSGRDTAELIGAAIGMSIWPFGAVLIFGRNRPTQRQKVKIFFIVSAALFCLGVITYLATQGYSVYFHK